MDIDDIFQRLHAVEQQNITKSGNYYKAKCPAHEDKDPSLTVKMIGDKIDIQCHAGCDIKAVCKALGINVKDLYNDDKKSFNIDKIYDYTDEHGKLIHQTVRLKNPKGFKQRRPDGKGDWIWRVKDIKTVLYRLPAIHKHHMDCHESPIYIVEGEKDCDTLANWDMTATCPPMGAGYWRDHYNEWFKGKSVILIPDNDSPGHKHMKAVGAILKEAAKTLAVKEVPKKYKDISEYAEANGGVYDSSDFSIISFDTWLNQKPTTPTDPKAITQSLLSLGPIEQAEKVKQISEETGISTRAINSELNIHKKAEKAQAYHQKTKSKLSAAEKVMEIMASNIVIPKNQLGQPQRLKAHVIISTPKEEYLTPYYDSKLYTAAPSKREIAKHLEEAGGETGFEVAMGGFDEKALNPTTQSIMNDVETKVQGGLMGKECEVSFGPYLDNKGKFNTITDIDNGVLILRGGSTDGALIVRDEPTPVRDDKALEEWGSLFGDNRFDCLAHAISSLINEYPKGKHCLGFVGSSGGGKTTAATWLAETIDYRASVISASGLEGNFPKLFSCLSPILDNLDNKSLSDENMDTIASALSSDVLTVQARYTKSGLTDRLGFPIFTSIHPDVLNYYRPLRSRAVLLIQNYDEKTAQLTVKSDEIIKAFRPMLYWLIELYLKDRKAGKIPERPGELRLLCFARVRYWIATKLQKMSDEKAIELIKSYIPNDAEEMSTPFIDAFIKSMDEYFKKDNSMFDDNRFDSKSILAIMRDYAWEELKQIPSGKKSNLAESSTATLSIKKQINKSRMQNKIGSYYIFDGHDDNKNKSYYEIRQADTATGVTS